MKSVVLLSLIVILTLTACAPAPASASQNLADRPIRVTATTGMVADLARNIGGERVTVTGLMGPGVDPHLYKARESDVRALQDADIIFYNGLHLEAGMSTVLEKMGEERPVVAVTDAIDRTSLNTPPQFAGNYDPHVWFDVTLWLQTIDVVRDALIKLDPTSADLYNANAESYRAQLQELDAYVRERAASLPEEKRVLITAHDAFEYFGRAYGFTVRGLQGISTESEAGASDVQSLADFIVERQIPAVFIESSVPQRNIEAVKAAVESRGWQVVIGGSLFSDAMGDPGKPEGSYTGMVRYNIDTIVAALAGQAGQP